MISYVPRSSCGSFDDVFASSGSGFSGTFDIQILGLKVRVSKTITLEDQDLDVTALITFPAFCVATPALLAADIID